MALEGLDIFKDLHEHKGTIAIRKAFLNMGRIGNDQGEVDGDKVYYDNITGIDLGDGTPATERCGKEVTCLGSERATLTMDKEIDKAFVLHSCRVNKLASLSSETRDSIISNAVTKIDNAQLTLEAKNHLAVVEAGLNEYTPSGSETDIYSIIEGMISKVEIENASSTNVITRSTDIVVVVSKKAASDIRKAQLGCCEFLNNPTNPTPNRWGVLDVVEVPANMMPAGVDVMVYVKDWALIGVQCQNKDVFEATEIKYKGYLAMSVFEKWGSHLITDAEFPEIAINPGEKYTLS